MTKLQHLKVGITAYTIFALACGYHGNFSRNAGGACNLKWFETHDPLFYYAYILPLAHTICQLMDNEKDSNLTVGAIVGKNLDSFVRQKMQTGLKAGIWSLEYLHSLADKNVCPGEIGIVLGGIEFNIARVYMMLANKVPLPDQTTWYITQEQSNTLLQRRNYSDTVYYRQAP
jgi:hypothetical protein